MTDIATWLADGISASALVVACGAAMWARAQAVETRRQRELAAQQHHLDRDPNPEFGQFSMTPQWSEGATNVRAAATLSVVVGATLNVVVTVRQDCLVLPSLMSPIDQARVEDLQEESPVREDRLYRPHKPKLLLQGIPTPLVVVQNLPPDKNLDGYRVRLKFWPPGTTSPAVPSWRCGCGQPEHPPKPHWERSAPVKLTDTRHWIKERG